MRWSPLDHFIEAGPTAYYQARVAYERGGVRERAEVRDALQRGEITSAGYSAHVFPAYLRVVRDGEDLFPPSEQRKSIDQLRAELASVVLGKAHGPQAGPGG